MHWMCILCSIASENTSYGLCILWIYKHDKGSDALMLFIITWEEGIIYMAVDDMHYCKTSKYEHCGIFEHVLILNEALMV